MSALQPGSKIHRYIVQKVLGSGGFGVVYQAQHKTLGYQVVIKEYLPQALAKREQGQVYPLSAEVADIYQHALTRFKAECETLLTLNHDNIVYVYDCFYDAGTAYMVMHQEHGSTLWQSYAEHVQRYKQAMSWQQLSTVLPGILAGLDYMHQRGVIHRDIKPGNIFLRSGNVVHPLLIDFGAVKVSGGYVSQYAQNTPCYAALEQDYDIHPIGPWTDVHALGVMLTELLTGQRPDTAYQRQTMLAEHGSDLILPLLQQVAQQNGDKVAQALYGATLLDPKKRLQSVAAFRQALL